MEATYLSIFVEYDSYEGEAEDDDDDETEILVRQVKPGVYKVIIDMDDEHYVSERTLNELLEHYGVPKKAGSFKKEGTERVLEESGESLSF